MNRVYDCCIIATWECSGEVLLHLIRGQAPIAVPVENFERKALGKMPNQLLHLVVDNAAGHEVPFTHQLPLLFSSRAACLLTRGLDCCLGPLHPVGHCCVAVISGSS